MRGFAQASTLVYVCGKDLCRTDKQRKQAVKLTRDGSTGAYSRPTISIDGKRLAFTRGSSIRTVHAAGGQAKRLVARGTQPAWGC